MLGRVDKGKVKICTLWKPKGEYSEFKTGIGRSELALLSLGIRETDSRLLVLMTDEK